MDSRSLPKLIGIKAQFGMVQTEIQQSQNSGTTLVNKSEEKIELVSH